MEQKAKEKTNREMGCRKETVGNMAGGDNDGLAEGERKTQNKKKN